VQAIRKNKEKKKLCGYTDFGVSFVASAGGSVGSGFIIKNAISIIRKDIQTKTNPNTIIVRIAPINKSIHETLNNDTLDCKLRLPLFTHINSSKLFRRQKITIKTAIKKIKAAKLKLGQCL
jgi:hypothetical protein